MHTNMTPGNFLQLLPEALTDKGFWSEIENDMGQWRNNLGTPLSVSTTPLYALAFSSMPAIYWAAGNVNPINLSIRIPVNFNKDDDKLRLRITAVMAGTTDTPTLTCSARRVRVGDTASTELTSVVSDAITGTAVAQYDIELSGNDLHPGDDVLLTLTPSAHATDILYITGISIAQPSSLIAYDPAERM